ncbi:MAG: SAM-dependent methyltransferase [Verrucomicrobiales bacterium]
MSEAAGRLYEDLESVYDGLWGAARHHGWWIEGGESPEQARRNLQGEIARMLAAHQGQSVLDIGCGGGEVGRFLEKAAGVVVSGVSLTAVEGRRAAQGLSGEVWVGDWAMWQGGARFEGLLALESLSHMADGDAFFQKCLQAGVPTARLLVADWFRAEDISYFERGLLALLARSGAVVWREVGEVERASADAWALREKKELGDEVARTWTAMWWRALGAWRRPCLLRALWRAARQRPLLLFAPFCARLAYATGALRYELLLFERK